jgi:glycosyltransferase involved in cell wall biosynthesis
MKIAIDLTPLYNRKITGVEIYGIEMYKALLNTEIEIYPIFRIKNTIDNNKNAIIINVENRLIVENLLLSKEIRKGKFDLIFFPIFPPPFDIYNIKSLKVIPTIHDLTIFKYPNMLTYGAKYYLKPKYKFALKYANQVVTISESVKNELKSYTNRPVLNWKNSISNGFYCIDNQLNEKILSKWLLGKNQYFISVSTIEPRKNFKYLLKIFDELLKTNPNLKLVLVGRKGWGNDDELKLLVDKLDKSLIFTNFVSTDELINLYHFAQIFFLLSVYEGFGRTPLEAIACGCKNIFVSDIPVFRETMNDFAEFLPLDSITKCVEMINNYDFNLLRKKTVKLPFGILENNVTSNIQNLFAKSNVRI